MKRYIYALIISAYCACYNIIQHGAEKTFFIGLAAAVCGIAMINYSIKGGLRFYPEETDYFDAFFTEDNEQLFMLK